MTIHAVALAELREITAEGRPFATIERLHRWGGVDAIDLYGLCPLCGCTKSGDMWEANLTTDACTDYGCVCHDEEAGA
jgi:hypothetical protein